MAKMVTFSLGSVEYEVPRLNIGQLEEISDVLAQTMSDGRRSLAILRIALRRARPAIEGDVGDIEMDLNDMGDAVLKVLDLAGLTKHDEGPPGAAVTAAA